jgi:hypothetical protein
MGNDKESDQCLALVDVALDHLEHDILLVEETA